MSYILQFTQMCSLWLGQLLHQASHPHKPWGLLRQKVDKSTTKCTNYLMLAKYWNWFGYLLGEICAHFMLWEVHCVSFASSNGCMRVAAVY